MYLKDNEVDLNLKEYRSLLAKQLYLRSYIDNFFKRCIELDEATVPKKGKTRDFVQNRKESPQMGISRDNNLRKAYKGINLQLEYKLLTFNLNNLFILSATSIQTGQPKAMADNTTASLEQLTCTDFLDFGEG